LVNPSHLGEVIKYKEFLDEQRLAIEELNPRYSIEEILVTSTMSENKEGEIDKSKKAEELVSGTGKKSKSYHGELSKKTYGEIQKISKDKNDPLQQKAKHMKKLIEQSRGRLKEKKDQEGRY